MSAEAHASTVGLPQQKRARSRRDELEFLPAALEIVETPVSPLGRAVAGTLILFFCIAVAWATFGHIDIIATAQGKIVPVGRIKVIQSIETGMVTAINVKDGDRVTEGQVLLELDRAAPIAERNRIWHDLIRSRLDVERLRALRSGIDSVGAQVEFRPPVGAPSYDVERTRVAMTAQAAQQAAKVSSLDKQIAQKAAEVEGITATITKLRTGLPFLEETAEVRDKAMRLEYGNRIAHLDAQMRLSDQRNELSVQERRALESTEARKALEAQREQTTAEYVRGVMVDLAEAETKSAQFTEDLAKAEKRIQDLVLRAPIDGTIQQLVVHTIGGVVTPAQTLMVVVPIGASIEVEAMVLNKDIGFVREGDPVEIKIDTFNFTLYGLVRGTVMSVSQDAIVRDKPLVPAGPDRQQGQPTRTSEPSGQELLYATRVSLDATRMKIEDRMINLVPGMAVTVEIKTSQRRIIEFLLSPLLRYKQESLRER